MDWIKAQKNLRDKPEVMGIASMVNLHVDTVVGKLLNVWGWADGVTTDGRIQFTNNSFIDRIAGKRGFAESMQKVGWLVWDGDTAILPHFERHNGKSAKLRATGAARQSASRFRNADTVTEVTQEALPDKRREDKRRKVNDDTPISPADDFPIPPEGFRSPEFSAAWLDFIQHRHDMKKPLTARAARACLNKLISWGERKAVVALRDSVANGWQGLFEPKATPQTADLLSGLKAFNETMEAINDAG